MHLSTLRWQIIFTDERRYARAVGMNPVIRARARVCTMCGCCTVARNRVRPNSVQTRLPGRKCASDASCAVKCASHQQSMCRCFKLACCSCLKRSLARSVRESQRPCQPRAHQCASRDARCATCYQSLSPCLKLECSSNPMRTMARCAATLDRASHKHGRSVCQAPGGTSGRRWPTAMVHAHPGTASGSCAKARKDLASFKRSRGHQPPSCTAR